MAATHINCPRTPYEGVTVAAPEDLEVGEELGLEVEEEVIVPVVVAAVPVLVAELLVAEPVAET